MDSDREVAWGFTVEGGRFSHIFRGPDDMPRSGVPPFGHVDLKGKTVLPGLVESHGHLILTGLMTQRLNLAGAESLDELCAMVGVHAKVAAAGGGWLLGGGWDQSRWQDYDEARLLRRLDAASLGCPVFLTRVDFHAALVNSAALRLGGVTAETDDPAGGVIARTRGGKPTGLLVDNAMQLVGRKIPPPSASQMREALLTALAECAGNGVTAFHDCGVGAEEIAIFERLQAEGRLSCRMHLMVDGTREDLRDSWLERGPRSRTADGLVQIRAIKMFADGALGSHGALLSQPYADRPDCVGIEIASRDLMQKVSEAALARGFQVATHAIGDLAASRALDAYEAAFARHGDGKHGDRRFRLEHAQIVQDADLGRMARLGIIASVQCVHCAADARWAAQRLGKRLAMAYRWRSFIETGVRLINGSDTPVEPSWPFMGMQVAVSRRGYDGLPVPGNAEGEALTRDQALAAMTIDASYAAFMDDVAGSIGSGKYADFIVVDRDPLRCAEGEIGATKVLETWLGGERIFRAN